MDIGRIDPSHVEVHKPTVSVVVVGRCTIMLDKVLLEDAENRFKKDCRIFLVDLCLQIKKRFLPESDWGLSLKEAMSNGCLLSAACLRNKYPSLITQGEMNVLDDQCRAVFMSKWDSLSDFSESSVNSSVCAEHVYS